VNDTPLDAAGDRGEDWGGVSTLHVSEVRELFVKLDKALRAYQLYEENNPVYQRFVTGLRDALRHFWETEERLTVTVEESRLLLEGEEVYANESRSDSLAFLFYKDGIRELEPFLEALHRVRHGGLKGDDLLTILWELDFQHFRYHYVDLLAEGISMPEAGPGAEPAQLMAAREAELATEESEEDEGAEEAADQAGEARPAAATVSRESFNPTLYALDPREMQQLEQEIALEMARDLRGDVLAALFDRLEEPENAPRQTEVLGIFRTLLPNFLSRGAIEAAAQVLAELRANEEKAGVFDDARRAEVSALFDELSSVETVEELVRALEDGSLTPSAGHLGAYIGHLRAGALGPLIRASETVMVKELQPVLREAVRGIAAQHRGELVGLLSAQDARVAAGAARLAGTLQITEAGPKLQDLLRHPDPSVRLAGVEAAIALRASVVAGTLQEVLTDPDRDVRIAAARALGALRYRPAAKRFRAVVMGKDVRAADVTEKIAFFEGYGELGDPEAVALLDKLLNGKGLLGRREPPELRAAAALGLGKVGTPEAREALARAARDEDPVVRSAVNRASRVEDQGHP
jgi:HEAT repeat protein